MTDDRKFPIQSAEIPSIPWAMIAPHEPRALKNHGQTLTRLAERGGLSADEVIRILNDLPWTDHGRVFNLSRDRAEYDRWRAERADELRQAVSSWVADRACPECEGAGDVAIPTNRWDGFEDRVTCPTCRGDKVVEPAAREAFLERRDEPMSLPIDRMTADASRMLALVGDDGGPFVIDRHEVGDLAIHTLALAEEVERLQNAIRHHRDQHGDDRCHLDDHALYVTTLPEDAREPADLALPPKCEFLKSCERFWEQRQGPGDKLRTEAGHGPDSGKTIRQLEDERETMLGLLARCYRSANRDGWEEGPTTDEVATDILNTLCNAGRDPTKKPR